MAAEPLLDVAADRALEPRRAGTYFRLLALQSLAFFFTFAAKPEWDERHVVFGVLRNRESLRTLFAIDQVGSQFGKPSQEVIISDCGQLWPPHHTQQKKKFTSTSGARHKSEQGFVDYDW